MSIFRQTHSAQRFIQVEALSGLGTKLLVALLLLLSPAFGAGAGESDRSLELPTVTYSVGDGLPSSHILDLDHDHLGRLWILNRLGVTLYDGKNFEPLSEGLVTTRLGALSLDEQGDAWVAIGWGEPELYRLVDRRWVLLPKLAEGAFSDAPVFLEVLRDEESSLIALGNVNGDLWLWNLKSESEGEESVSAPRRPETSAPSGQIFAMERTQGRIAIGGENGLCFLSASGQLKCGGATLHPKLSSPIHALHEQSLGGDGARLWIVGEDQAGGAQRASADREPELDAEESGAAEVVYLEQKPTPIWLGFLEDGELTVVAEYPLLPALDLRPLNASDYCMSLTLDSAGGVYFGNVAALHYLDPERLAAIEIGSEQGLGGSGATTLLTDRESGVWIGRPGSLNRIGSRRFVSYDRDQGLLEDEVTAVAETASGQIVLAHNLGLTFLDGTETTTIAFDRVVGSSRNAYRVFNMEVDVEGVIWLATVEAGLLRVGLDRRVTVELPELPLPRAFATDPAGRLWLAGTTGLFVQTEEGFKLGLETEEPLNVRGFDITPEGHFLIAAEEGLLIHRGGEWAVARFDRQEDEPSDRGDLFSVLALRSGEIWGGSVAGLATLRDDELVANEHFPDLKDPIFFMFQDPQDQVWLGTRDGVRIWNGSDWRHLSVREGLAGRETNRGAGFVDRSGTVWVGTGLGVSSYRERYDRETPAPGLALIGAQADGEQLSLAGPMELEHSQTSLTFQFQTISLGQEGDLKVRYRLEGLESSLSKPVSDSSRQVRYTNLVPGTYRFRIQAGWDEGAWSEEVISVPITIMRPFWSTASFRVAALFLILGSVFGFYRLRTRVMRSRAEALEEINEKLQRAAEERERLIESLEAQNVELERFNFTVSHDLKSPLVSIRGFTGFVRQAVEDGELQQASDDLVRIDEAAERMVRLLKELFSVAHVRGTIHGPQKVLIQDLAFEALEQLGTEIQRRGARVEVEAGTHETWGDRERLRMMLHHVIDNAIKFNTNECPQVIIRAEEEGQRTLITVTDNGIGIEPEHRDKIFGLFKQLDASSSGTGAGLTLVTRIVEAHGGNVWVEGRAMGTGSRFVMALPRQPELVA